MSSFRQSQLALSLFVWTMPVCWVSFPQGEVTSTPDPHDLRSAFLLREGVVNYQGHSATEYQAELRRHFDAVLAILELNTPQAIELALDRLEASQGKAWSPTEREQHRNILLAGRDLQLARLRAYRDRGLFPQNEGHANYAVPIFVDNHDTACAVGHLMRLAGWEAEVSEIRATNNLVYVPDAADSSVAEWALTAGVTLEEAALIQPGYSLPTPYSLPDYVGTGASLTIGGLKFSNFTYSSADYNLHSSCATLAPGCNPILSIAIPPPFTWIPASGVNFPINNSIGIGIGEGEIDNGIGAYLWPVGTHWIAFGGVKSPGGDSGAIVANSKANTGQHVQFNFKVETVSPTAYIDQATLQQYLYEGGFFRVDPYTYNIMPTDRFWLQARLRNISSSVTDLLISYQNYNNSSSVVNVTGALAPTSALDVEVDVWLRNGVRMNSFVMNFNVVPEPSSWLLFASGFVAVALVARYRKRGA